MQERIKVKALSEELENPNNKHRWRKLEGSDPGTYEMLQKIQALQKRLILKTEEVVEKDLLIQEKDKLYVELKNILARQPGPEARGASNVAGKLKFNFPDVPGQGAGIVAVGGVEKIAEHPDRTLFLCYPPTGDMAKACLDAYAGELFVYVG